GALAQVEHAYSFGGMQLVSGERKHIDGRISQIDWNFSDRLDRVGMEKDTALPGHFGCLLDGKNHPCFVVCPHEANDCRVQSQRPSIQLHIEPPFAIHRQFGYPVSLGGQMSAKGAHRRVLDPACHDMLFVRAACKGRADGRVVALRSAARKDDLPGRCAQKSGNLFARFSDLFHYLASEGVHARRISIELIEIWEHCFQHFRGHLGRRIVIQIYRFHADTSSTTSSGQTSSRSFASTKFFNVWSDAWQDAHAPRVATSTRLPTTSTSSMSPPSCFRAGRISRSRVSSIILIFRKLDIFGLSAGAALIWKIVLSIISWIIGWQ